MGILVTLFSTMRLTGDFKRMRKISAKIDSFERCFEKPSCLLDSMNLLTLAFVDTVIIYVNKVNVFHSKTAHASLC